jgi:YegS/Rv2252/BmrU family lipid kinase
VEKWVANVDNQRFGGWVMLVCNPVSGMGRGREHLAAVERTLREADVPYRSALTQGRGHAAELARSAGGAGCGTVVAIGGDGTLFEVVNGVMGASGEEPPEMASTNPVAVGLIGAGRGSDFARSAGVPSDVEAAVRRLVSGRSQVVDVGHVAYRAFSGERRRRYFINAAGMGFDAEVALRANRAPRVMGGTIPYLSSLATTLVRYHNKQVSASLDGGRVEWQARISSIVVANGQFFGGGMKIAPEASLSDGEFEVVVLGDLGKVDLVRNVPRVYDGSHVTHPKVSMDRARQVSIESPQRLLLQADGEVLGTAPATFTVVPAALRVIV